MPSFNLMLKSLQAYLQRKHFYLYELSYKTNQSPIALMSFRTSCAEGVLQNLGSEGLLI
jgi:hypothetical protein